MNRVNNFGSQSLSSPSGCNIRRKSILGIIRYKDVSFPLQNLPVLPGCALAQPQLVAVALIVGNIVFLCSRCCWYFWLLQSCTSLVSPSLFFFSMPSLSFYYKCGQSTDSRRSTLALSLEIWTLLAVTNKKARKLPILVTYFLANILGSFHNWYYS